MKNPATFRRVVAAVALVVAPLVMLVAMSIDVPFSGDPDELLVALRDAGAAAWVSAVAYALAQIALIPAVLGIAHLLRARAPRLSAVGGSLAVLGALGHLVHAGGVLVLVAMAQGAGDRAALATAVAEYQRSPAGLFSAMGLIGTVLGLVLLTVGLWRGAVRPRWVPAALAAFLVLEFVGSGVSRWVSAVAGLLYVGAFVALAATVRRGPVDDWRTVAERGAEDDLVEV